MESRHSFSSGRQGITWIEIVVLIALALILAGVAFPVIPTNCGEKGPATAALANAKQIGVSCKLFAGDYNGRFPSKVNEDENESVPVPDATNSNDAFNSLVPTYGCTENLFYNKTSAWSSRKGDGDKNLEAGENNYAYFAGLKEDDNSNWPLICDGWKEGNVGVYSTDPGMTGGVWKGKKVIVIRVDGSGKLETLKGEPDPRFMGRASETGPIFDMLKPDPAMGWLVKAAGRELSPLK